MPHKALVAEPSRVFRELLVATLAKNGFETTTRENPFEALTLAESTPFDLVVSALHLSGLSGIEFCSRLSRQPISGKRSIVLITSDDDRKTQEEAMRSGITTFFSKKEFAQFALYVERNFGAASRATAQSGRVLYIEDNRSEGALIEAQLNANGFSVVFVNNAKDALDRFTDEPFDLVITDLVLGSGMMGDGLVSSIRNCPGRAGQVPILVITGFDDPMRKVKLLQTGANDYVAKPVLIEELVARAGLLVTMRKLLDSNEEQKSKLNELAMRDQLTGLYNRHYLVDTAPKMIGEACRHGLPLSLLVIDIDHFKQINDTHGHATGDLVIRAVGDCIERTSRIEDIAARFGGEEFVLLLSHCDESAAEQKAQSLRIKLQDLAPDGIHFTASIGVATLPLAKPCLFDKLFRAADKAVFEAKQNGRNCVVVGKA